MLGAYFIALTFFADRIDSNGGIKVADFGLSKTMYEKLYFRQDRSDSVRLPFKWLAIECLEDGLFSEKSDVVSNCIQCIFTASWVTSKGIDYASVCMR